LVISIISLCNANCGGTFDGVTYDLSNLRNDEKDYSVTYDLHHWLFLINVCRQTVTNDCGGNSEVCQKWGISPQCPYDCASLGLYSTATFSALEPKGTGISMDITGGDLDRKTTIRFICSPTDNEPVFVTEDPQHYYHFDWYTEEACPKEPSSLKCCLFQNGPEDKVLCTPDSCPSISRWTNVAQWPVEKCKDCFFEKK